jgi:two-component system phosphate regulon response regulator PhoB
MFREKGIGMETQRILFVGAHDALWMSLAEQLKLMGIDGVRKDSVDIGGRREDFAGMRALLIGPSLQGRERMELCRQLRAISPCPLMVIAGGIEEAEELRLVVAGVCDVVHLPLRPRVLAAQLANRIGHSPDLEPTDHLTYENLVLNSVEHAVSVDGSPVYLTRTEFDLLALLMDNPKRVYTHEELSRWIWHDPWNVDHHRLEAHVCRLRKKILIAGGPAIIGSVRGVGYRLVATANLAGVPQLAG